MEPCFKIGPGQLGEATDISWRIYINGKLYKGLQIYISSAQMSLSDCVFLDRLGPQIRIVWSSLADANIWSLLGFQLTQFTVIEWPIKTSIGLELRRFQM